MAPWTQNYGIDPFFSGVLARQKNMKGDILSFRIEATSAFFKVPLSSQSHVQNEEFGLIPRGKMFSSAYSRNNNQTTSVPPKKRFLPVTEHTGSASILLQAFKIKVQQLYSS